MDNNITRTLYGAVVQDNLLLNLPQEYPPFTTINQHLSIQNNNIPAATDKPAIGLWIWGNRGHRIAVGADGIPLNDPIKHMATDAGLFNQLPFVLREVSNDLTAAQRTKYCLRRIEERNGINYIAYYGRRLDKTNMRTTMYYTQVQDGEQITDVFIPTQSNLTPTPVTTSNTGVNLLAADYVSAKARMEIKLTEVEIADMLNVAKVIYNDERYAIISEIGVCTNVDKNIIVDAGNGGSFQFAESVGVQIAAHIATYNSLQQSNTGVTIALNIGLNEPLYNLSITDGSATGGGVVAP